MARVVAYCIVLVATLSLFPDRASALVAQESVTPASVQEKGSKFSVKAEKGEDGLIHFAITFQLSRPQYLVAHFEVRDGETVLAKTDTPSFVHDDAVTYDVAVSPKCLANSKFELGVYSFGVSGGKPVPLPGGTDYEIQLAEFGKDAPPIKSE